LWSRAEQKDLADSGTNVSKYSYRSASKKISSI